jgi:hypothetical protein
VGAGHGRRTDLASAADLQLIIDCCIALRVGAAIDFAAWLTSGYQPTPSIVEAAQALYQQHGVEEIARSDAGARNLGATTDCIAEIIESSKANRRKSICLVTGVPGAGKTLAGLNMRRSGHRNTRMSMPFFYPETGRSSRSLEAVSKPQCNALAFYADS